MRTRIIGKAVTATSIGTAGYRFMFERKHLDGEPDHAWLLEGLDGPRLVGVGDELDRVIFVYLCRDKTLVNVMARHRDSRDQNSFEWDAPATAEDVLTTFSGFHDKYLKILALGRTSTVKHWQLRSLPPLPTWVKGRACLIGDAAHGMLPTLGAGASQGIEDAAALGVLLPLGTTREDIPKRLEAYQTIRKQRAEMATQGSLDVHRMRDKAALFRQSAELQNNWLSYDVVSDAKRYLQEMLCKEDVPGYV